MNVEVREEPITTLDAYATIPIAFEVATVMDVEDSRDGLGEYLLTERSLQRSYEKDYDAIDGESPNNWPARFDMSNWGILVALVEGRRAGGAVVAFNTSGLDMLEGREDLAVLWDIRVSPPLRGSGVGRALLQAAEAWSTARGCRRLKVETQNINVAACRFYARQGFAIASVRRSAYPGLPNEIQLLWEKSLAHQAPSRIWALMI